MVELTFSVHMLRVNAFSDRSFQKGVEVPRSRVQGHEILAFFILDSWCPCERNSPASIRGVGGSCE